MAKARSRALVKSRRSKSHLHQSNPTGVVGFVLCGVDRGLRVQARRWRRQEMLDAVVGKRLPRADTDSLKYVWPGMYSSI